LCGLPILGKIKPKSKGRNRQFYSNLLIYNEKKYLHYVVTLLYICFNKNNNAMSKLKKYTFTTRDQDGHDVETYFCIAYHLQETRKYAREIVGISRSGEMSHSRIKLAQ
jgi:hypothetical protein